MANHGWRFYGEYTNAEGKQALTDYYFVRGTDWRPAAERCFVQAQTKFVQETLKVHMVNYGSMGITDHIIEYDKALELPMKGFRWYTTYWQKNGRIAVTQPVLVYGEPDQYDAGGIYKEWLQQQDLENGVIQNHYLGYGDKQEHDILVRRKVVTYHIHRGEWNQDKLYGAGYDKHYIVSLYRNKKPQKKNQPTVCRFYGSEADDNMNVYLAAMLDGMTISNESRDATGNLKYFEVHH